MYQHGWYQIAFERDIPEGLTPIYFAQRRLMAVKHQDSLRVVDATCPHRGAHLAYGGTLSNDHNEVICPFHGLRIRLGDAPRTELCVHDYPCLVQGGMVFIRLSDLEDPNVPLALAHMEQRYTFISGFETSADVPFETAAENALDSLHFKTIHELRNVPSFTVDTGPYGELRAEAELRVPSASGASDLTSIQCRIGVFSPGVLISEFRGEPPYNYNIVSTTTPVPKPNKCIIRLTLAIDASIDQRFVEYLLKVSEEDLEKDKAIWKHLAADHTPQWTPWDVATRAYVEFCARFRH